MIVEYIRHGSCQPEGDGRPYHDPAFAETGGEQAGQGSAHDHRRPDHAHQYAYDETRAGLCMEMSFYLGQDRCETNKSEHREHGCQQK
jgi:hypothetical protein